MNKIFIGLLSMILMSSAVGICSADEVTDSLNEAIKQYQKGEYPSAIATIEYASGLIREKRSQNLEEFLPKALSGWYAEEPTSRTISAAMFGGGVFVERRYIKDYSVVTIQIATDSPMLQGVMSMFTNQMFLTASGAKVQKIKGQKAIVEYNPSAGNGNIKIIVANRILVSISGEAVSSKDLVSYANNVDYDKINSLL